MDMAVQKHEYQYISETYHKEVGTRHIGATQGKTFYRSSRAPAQLVVSS
jgi:hypothetical protein